MSIFFNMLGVYLNLLKGNSVVWYKLKTLWAQKKHDSKYLDNAPWFKSIIIELVEKMNPRWGPSLYFVSESELKLKVLGLRSFIILTPMTRLKGMWRLTNPSNHPSSMDYSLSPPTVPHWPTWCVNLRTKLTQMF